MEADNEDNESNDSSSVSVVEVQTKSGRNTKKVKVCCSHKCSTGTDADAQYRICPGHEKYGCTK
jgi:hypothetical protein